MIDVFFDAAGEAIGLTEAYARIDALTKENAKLRAFAEELERENKRAMYFLTMIRLQLDDDRPDGPGHSHWQPGIWDRDNGDMTGKPCEWCAMWRELRPFIVGHNVEPTGVRRLYGARPCAAPCYVALRVRRVARLLTYSLNTPSMRPCHPSPVLRKYAMTFGLYRTETSSFLFPDFGRPRTDFSGTMAASCFFVRGCASGSALAAARIFAFSAGEGI